MQEGRAEREELPAHAGRTRYGYVEPAVAAWWLLEQAVEPWLEDITRRATLGLSDAARRLGLGVLQDLYYVRDRIGDDGPPARLGARLPQRDR